MREKYVCRGDSCPPHPELGSSGEKGFTAEGGGLGGTLEAI